MNPLYCSIEGPIGAYKTTSIQTLKCMSDEITFIGEQLEKWRCVQGRYNLLQSAIDADNTENWAVFQFYALITNMKSIYRALTKTEHNLIITDRSLESQRNVFWPALHSTGRISSKTLAVLQETILSFEEMGIYKKPDIYIYLKDTPENCLARCIKRGRPEESGYTLSYFEKLHEMHEKWLGKNKQITTPVYTIEVTNKTTHDMISEMKDLYVFLNEERLSKTLFA